MKKKGFTLIELLAVIIILAVIALITTPIVLNVVDNARESARKSSIAGYADATKMAIYDYQFANKGSYPTVDKIWADENVTTGGEKVSCEEVKFGSSGVILKNCQVENNEKKYCFANGKVYDDCNDKEFLEKYEQNIVSGPKKCTFNGELKQGAEFVDGQYIYRYMQKIVIEDSGTYFEPIWRNISEEGWTVRVKPEFMKAEELTTQICSEINDKPLINTSYTFFGNAYMSYGSDFSNHSVSATKINLKNFDTSNVIDMSGMFYEGKTTTLDLSDFDTSNVTNMSGMFWGNKTPILDLSSFDTSNVIDMSRMFYKCGATIGYARTQADADRFNNAEVTGIPDTLKFVVKP